MRRFGRMLWVFVTSSFIRETEFRINFLAKLVQNAVWVLWFLLVLLVIYRNTNSIAGWDRGEGFVLGATTFLMSAIYGLFFRSMLEIPESVRKGTMDFILTKPIDSQFWATMRRFNFDQVGSLIAGMIFLGYGVAQLASPPNPLQWATYSVLLIVGIALFYSFNLFLMSLSVWFVRVDNLWVLSETLLDVSRFPIDIFARTIQTTLIFIIPLAFFATMPARQLTIVADPVMLALGLGWGIAALIASRIFWRYALRSYSSASS